MKWIQLEQMTIILRCESLVLNGKIIKTDYCQFISMVPNNGYNHGYKIKRNVICSSMQHK